MLLCLSSFLATKNGFSPGEDFLQIQNSLLPSSHDSALGLTFFCWLGHTLYSPFMPAHSLRIGHFDAAEIICLLLRHPSMYALGLWLIAGVIPSAASDGWCCILLGWDDGINDFFSGTIEL